MLRHLVVIAAMTAAFSNLAKAQTTKPTAAPANIEWHADLNIAQRIMVEKQRPMMLFVTVPGCTYCELMKQQVFTQPSIRKEVGSKYVPTMINGRQHKTVASQLGIRMYPVVAVVHPTGKVVEVIRGYKNPASFAKVMAVAKAKLDMHSKQLASAKKPAVIK